MSDNPEALHQRLMTQIQEFACAWSFAGGPFDDGDGMDRANELKVEVESALRAALAQQAATPRRRPDRQPEPTDLTHYRAVCDLWAEANAVDTVLGSRDRLLAKVTRLRDAMGAGVPLEERQAATPTSRTPTDYALEHAEYMAVRGEALILAVNDSAQAELHREEADEDEDAAAVEQAREGVSEACRGLRDKIFEFRKRRDRAARRQAATPAPAEDELLRRVDAELAKASPDELAAMGRRSEQAFDRAFRAAGLQAATPAPAEESYIDRCDAAFVRDFCPYKGSPDPLTVWRAAWRSSLAAPPATPAAQPADERNQCDGCQASMPMRGDIHTDEAGHAVMSCQRGRYAMKGNA